MSSNRAKSRILFVRPAYGTLVSRRIGIVTEPLELEYLSAVATEEGYTHQIHDPAVTGKSFEEVLKTFEPGIVAIAGYYPAKDAMLEYARRAKRIAPDIMTLVGGAHAEINHSDYYDDMVDMVVYSGGASTFRTLLRSLHKGDMPTHLPGTCLRLEDRTWRRNESATLDLADLPMPDRSHFNEYQEHFTYLHYGPVALLKTAYGCPFKCMFCYCRMLNSGHYAARPLRDVVAEIEEIRCERIWIVDDTFLVDMERIHAFVDLLKERKIRKEFIIYSRAEFIAKNPAVLPLLKSAGVINVIIGFEAVTEEKLKAYNKMTTDTDSRNCIRLLKDHDIECTGLFIMDTDATVSDFRALDRWITETGLKTYTLSVFSPYPGTEQFDQYKDRLTTSDCRKWDLLHLVMNPTGMSRPLFYILMGWMHLKVLFRNREIRRHVLSRGRARKRSGTKKRNIWDFWAAHYDSLWVQHVSLGPTRQELLRNIPVRAGLSILDMGCGTGQLLGDLRNHFGDTPFRYKGVDQSKEMCAVASEKYPTGDFSTAPSGEYLETDEKYDVIVCAHSFPYFPEKTLMLEKLNGALTDDGILLIAQASMNGRYDRIMLSIVKLTTSQAQYYSCRRMRETGRSVFDSVPEETRISPHRWMPSIYLFKWSKRKGAQS